MFSMFTFLTDSFLSFYLTSFPFNPIQSFIYLELLDLIYIYIYINKYIYIERELSTSSAIKDMIPFKKNMKWQIKGVWGEH